MKIGNVCIAVVALLAGAAAGYCVGRYVTPSSAPAEVRDEKPRHSQRAGVGNDAEKKILRERVAAQEYACREAIRLGERKQSANCEAYPPTEGRCRRRSLEWCRKAPCAAKRKVVLVVFNLKTHG